MLLPMLGIALMVGIPTVAFLVRVNRELALRRQHDEQSEEQHTLINRRLSKIEADMAGTREDVAWLKGKQNGKH